MTRCDICGTKRAITYKEKGNSKVCLNCYNSLKELENKEGDETFSEKEQRFRVRGIHKEEGKIEKEFSGLDLRIYLDSTSKRAMAGEFPFECLQIERIRN